MKRKRVLIFVVFFILGILIVSVCAYFVHKNYRTNKYNSDIIKIAKRYSLDPRLIKAVIWRESGFDDLTLGGKGEIGLMQIVPSSAVKEWAEYNKSTVPFPGILYIPINNINIGAWYLTRCKRHWKGYKDWLVLTLAEYNAGYSNAKKWAPKDKDADALGNITFPSTKDYVSDIISRYALYKESDDCLDTGIEAYY